MGTADRRRMMVLGPNAAIGAIDRQTDHDHVHIGDGPASLRPIVLHSAIAANFCRQATFLANKRFR